MEENLVKPPLGLKPRWLVYECRLKEIDLAISRYIQANRDVPVEWMLERSHILTWLKEDKNKKSSH